MILNELVLDIASWLERHPGGLWVLKHNIGKDISKFFYGGYAQDGNESIQNNPGHAHSNNARKAVNELAIARYSSTIVSSAKCRIRTPPDACNSLTKNFTFTAVDIDAKPDHFRLFFPGLKTLGKNYLVQNVPIARELAVTRQYSICYALNDAICNNVIQCLNENSKAKFNSSLFDSRSSNRMVFTIKNYKTQCGLSKVVHEQSQFNKEYLVQGPYGKGLLVQQTGQYIVFAAGTGVLCYLDLVL